MFLILNDLPIRKLKTGHNVPHLKLPSYKKALKGHNVPQFKMTF